MLQVASYRPWINCIIQEVAKGHTQKTIESTCTNAEYTHKFEQSNMIQR